MIKQNVSVELPNLQQNKKNSRVKFLLNIFRWNMEGSRRIYRNPVTYFGFALCLSLKAPHTNPQKDLFFVLNEEKPWSLEAERILKHAKTKRLGCCACIQFFPQVKPDHRPVILCPCLLLISYSPAHAYLRFEDLVEKQGGCCWLTCVLVYRDRLLQ